MIPIIGFKTEKKETKGENISAAQIIKQRMKASKLKHEEVAKWLNTSSKTVQRALNGEPSLFAWLVLTIFLSESYQEYVSWFGEVFPGLELYISNDKYDQVRNSEKDKVDYIDLLTVYVKTSNK